MNDDMGVIGRILDSIRNVEKKFANIQGDSVLNGPENGLTAAEVETLEKLIALNGEAAFAAEEICRRADTSRGNGGRKLPPPYGGGIIDNCGGYTPEENSMSDDMAIIMRALVVIRNIKEKYARIQEDPALHGPENALTAEEVEILEKLIALSGEAAFAAKEIYNRFLGMSKT
jgi:hypothetical protein